MAADRLDDLHPRARAGAASRARAGAGAGTAGPTRCRRARPRTGPGSSAAADAAASAADVVVVHRVAEHDVAVGVEAPGELRALVLEVALDRVPPARERVLVALAAAAEALLELELGAVAHRADPARDRHARGAVPRPAARRSSRRRGSSDRLRIARTCSEHERDLARPSPSPRTRSRPRCRPARGTRPPTRGRASRPSIRRRRAAHRRCRAGRRARPRRRPGRGSSRSGSASRRGGRRPPATPDRSCPGSRRARWGRPRSTGRCRSRARGRSGRPTSRPRGGPDPAGPAAWLSPVSACSTSTAFDRCSSSVPQVSYATVTCSRRPPASSTRGRASNSVANCAAPRVVAGAPRAGDGDAARVTSGVAVTASGYERTRPSPRGSRPRGRRGCRRATRCRPTGARGRA